MDEQHVSEEGVARRRFLKQAATVAWASPLIVTMMSRTAHAQLVQCGTQDPAQPGFCVVTTPCGTAQVCFPDFGKPGHGNPCFCITPPG